MATLAELDNEVLAGLKTREVREAPAPLSGSVDNKDVKWGYREATFDGRPMVEVYCPKCKTLLRSESADFTWRHCGIESVVPQHLNDRLVKKQVKMGLRKPEGLLAKLFPPKESKPEAKPALGAF